MLIRILADCKVFHARTNSYIFGGVQIIKIFQISEFFKGLSSIHMLYGVEAVNWASKYLFRVANLAQWKISIMRQKKTVSVPKKQYHSLHVLFFRSNLGKARLCKGLNKTFVRTSLPELTRSLDFTCRLLPQLMTLILCSSRLVLIVVPTISTLVSTTASK